MDCCLSRPGPFGAVPPCGYFDDLLYGAQAEGASQAGGDDEIGAPAFFGVGYLARQDLFQAFRRHPRPGKDSSHLKEPRGGRHHHRVATAFSTGLEKQGNVKDHEGASLYGGGAQEAILEPANQWVKYGFQSRQGVRVAEYRPRQGLVVDGAIFYHAWKGGPYRTNRFAVLGQELMNRAVGVVHRYAQSAEVFGGGGFTHADRSGQADNHHQPVPRNT